MKLASTPEEEAEVLEALKDLCKAIIIARRTETDPNEVDSMNFVEAEALRTIKETDMTQYNFTSSGTIDLPISNEGGGGGDSGSAYDNGWVLATDFPGSDLGAQINAALDAGNLTVEIPSRNGLVIKTTVRLRHACTLKFANRYPNHIECKTNGKPVFEAIGSVRHWHINAGIFNGSDTQTPSCFLLCGRTTNGEGQCGDTTPMERVMCTGNWGVGVVINIAGEILIFERCHLWIQGKGDSKWTGPRSTVIISNMDYWNLPWSYTIPSKQSGSCSAIIFSNCDIRGGNANSTAVLLKGQVEDVTLTPSYINATWKCGVLIEAGDIGGGNWKCPRRLLINGGGRFETNTGQAWAGVPMILVDGLDIGGMGIYELTIGPIGFFVGGTSNSTPAIKTERGGLIYSLTIQPGVHFESTDTILDHRTADLNYANIFTRFNKKIDVSGRNINDSMIWSGGQVLGNSGNKSLIKAANITDWTL